jgi:MFS family permease
VSDGQSAERAAQERYTPRQVLLIFGGLLLAMLTAALNQTIVSTALPTIVGELGGLDQLSWVVTAYLLASTVSTPLWGKLGDVYGRKPLFQVSIVIFLVGSVLSGFSSDRCSLASPRTWRCSSPSGRYRAWGAVA